jgi:hypothetical protein
MKNCPFKGNPNFIVMYHDGVMPAELEKRFSDHLVTCRPCMEALLSLKNDLFSMRTSGFVPVPQDLAVPVEECAGGRGISSRRALFRFIRGALRLVESPPGPGGFKLHEMPEFLEKQGVTGKAYRWGEGGVVVYLQQEGENRFNVVVQGLAGRSVTLLQNGRVFESHARVQEDNLAMGGLTCGSFEIAVDDEIILLFHVEEVHGS